MAMASITEAAARALEAALGGRDDRGYAVARMVRSGAAWSLKRDREMPGDECIEWEGRTILVLDPETSSALAGTVLDVQKDPSGPRLVLTEED
jgi:Fe-S cluster assembly iron-binding protein IscA